jgi:hypothetical protein
MQIQLTLTEQTNQLIEDLRMNHIDAQLIIKEELDQTLPEYIECFLRGICGEVGK